MRITPVNCLMFGRKAMPAEIKKLQHDLRSAKHNYRRLEDNFVCQTPEGFSALGRAMYAGKGYAYRHSDGEMRIINDCLEYEDTLSECQENLKTLAQAKMSISKKIQEGMKLFYESHPKEKEIVSKARNEFRKTETGVTAAKELRAAQDRYNRARNGEDIETILAPDKE